MSQTTTLNLDGKWLLRSDPGNVGLAESWYANQVEDITQWTTCYVPGAWQHTLGTTYHYLAWYRRTFMVPDNWCDKFSRSWIRFQAVATQAQIWIDEKFVGSHTGDYIPFEFEITDFIKPGQSIELVVRVDEMLGHITKGFHDMVSLHHGGIWQPVTIIGTGKIHIPRENIAIIPDTATNNVTVKFDAVLNDNNTFKQPEDLRIKVNLTDHNNNTVAQITSELPATKNNSDITLTLNVADPIHWSPDNPCLYDAEIEIFEGSKNTVSEIHNFTWGFRCVKVTDKHLLLNDNPIHIRGILHWGHEPEHIAPAPTPVQVREQFSRLLNMGFNCVCLCMWYPPEYFFEIADEMGMLIWQEQPVWHSPMDGENQPEYRRLYTEFIKRDRNHTCVIIVSATCEHPGFDKGLAAWWWETAHRELPGRALQVQTSSFAWSDPEQTDLYDEHTYENNNRWGHYLADLQDYLQEHMAASKPFIMGESVLFTSWPDLPAIKSELNDNCKQWWAPQYLESGLQFESMLVKKYGFTVLQRFQQQAENYHLQGRKFQIEKFRAYENHAGLVMNHIRDVPLCTCGFMDDFDHWRFSPDQTNTWLADTVLFLETPDNRRSFYSSENSVSVLIGISNFSKSALHEKVFLELDIPYADSAALCERNNYVTESAIDCEPGTINRVEFRITIPDNTAENNNSFEKHNSITRLTAHACIKDYSSNNWDLWVFPQLNLSGMTGIYRLTGLPYSPDDYEPDKVERGYSRGFGIPAKSWISTLPDTTALLPDVPAWQSDTPLPIDAKVIITHKLTNKLIDFMVSAGGRVILLANKTNGGIGTRFEWLFGGCPLVIEKGPISQNDSEWIVDLLGIDLTYSYCRIIPSADSGLCDDYIDPLIRLVYTHNQKIVQMYDFMWMTNLGSNNGLLLVSSLDHSLPAGKYLLNRMLEFAQSENACSATELPVEIAHTLVYKTNKT